MLSFEYMASTSYLFIQLLGVQEKDIFVHIYFLVQYKSMDPYWSTPWVENEGDGSLFYQTVIYIDEKQVLKFCTDENLHKIQLGFIH